MINKLKSALRLIKNWGKSNLSETQTPQEPVMWNGINISDKKRVEEMPHNEEGEVEMFGHNFYFCDNLGFVHSVHEIFQTDVYKFQTTNPKPLIIDCGANMGLSVLYFKKNYPNAEIIAFEPDHEIFKILEKNISSFPNNKDIVIKEEAVWTEDTTLTFYSEGSLAGSISVDYSEKDQKTEVKATDLKKYLNQPVEFLKMDIEGAENTVIFDIRNQLQNVKNLFLEYHGIIGEKQNLGNILNLLTEEGFEYYIRLAGETMFFPFCNEEPQKFNQQLNIFCYRK